MIGNPWPLLIPLFVSFSGAHSCLTIHNFKSFELDGRDNFDGYPVGQGDCAKNPTLNHRATVSYPYSNLATWFRQSSGNGYKASSNINLLSAPKQCHLIDYKPIHVLWLWSEPVLLVYYTLHIQWQINTLQYIHSVHCTSPLQSCSSPLCHPWKATTN